MFKNNLEKFIFDSLCKSIEKEQKMLAEHNIDRKVMMVDAKLFTLHLQRNYKESRIYFEELNATISSLNRRLIVKIYSINGRGASQIGIGNKGEEYLKSFK